MLDLELGLKCISVPVCEKSQQSVMFTAWDSIYDPSPLPLPGASSMASDVKTRTQSLGSEVKRAPYKEKIFIPKSII